MSARSHASNLRRIGPWELHQRVYSVRHALLGTIIELHAERGKGRQDPDAAAAYALVRLARPQTGPPVKVDLGDLRSLEDLQERLQRLTRGLCPDCGATLSPGPECGAQDCAWDPSPAELVALPDTLRPQRTPTTEEADCGR